MLSIKYSSEKCNALWKEHKGTQSSDFPLRFTVFMNHKSLGQHSSLQTGARGYCGYMGTLQTSFAQDCQRLLTPHPTSGDLEQVSAAN